MRPMVLGTSALNSSRNAKTTKSVRGRTKWRTFSTLWVSYRTFAEFDVDSIHGKAGTFLTVNTLFIDASSSALQPDDARTTVDVLYTISQQINGTHTVASPRPFERNLLDVIQCSFIFASLLLSLIAAGLGLWVKEWLREYLLDLPTCPREHVHVRQFRHRGIHGWHMRQHVSTISFLLNFAIALFSVGLMLFARKIDLTLYSVLICLLGLWAVMTWGTALLPAASATCPYRSPVSRGLYVAVHRVAACLRKTKYMSMVNYERTRAKAIGTDLEVEALEYVNREYWGHEDLQAVNKCFKDIKPADAKAAIQAIIVERMTKDHKMFVHIRNHDERAGELSNLPSDGDTLNLLKMWGSIPSEPSPGQARSTSINVLQSGSTSTSEYKDIGSQTQPQSDPDGQSDEVAHSESDQQLWNRFKLAIYDESTDLHLPRRRSFSLSRQLGVVCGMETSSNA